MAQYLEKFAKEPRRELTFMLSYELQAKEEIWPAHCGPVFSGLDQDQNQANEVKPSCDKKENMVPPLRCLVASFLNWNYNMACKE